ncbi:MAG: pdhC [Chlamydiia bacterium]|nr:pdhC [Chlamydiia bacterium]
MPFTLTMPKLSPTMVEGTITKWHKKPGEYVEADELLLEVATDKATVEYNALDAGWIRKVMVPEGKKAQVNEPLAILTEKEKETIDGYEPEGETPPQQAKQPITSHEKPKAATLKAIAPTPAKPTTPAPTQTAASRPNPQSQQSQKSARVLASPLAKTLARDRGVDINQLKGTGPHGRIMSRDLDQEVTHSETQNVSHEVIEETLTPMRRVIGERLQYSKSTIPHFYITQEIDVESLVKFREETKKVELGLTVNDFIIKAVAVALRKHPQVNSGFNPENQTILRYPTVDLAVAVTIAGGLITPIVRQADTKSLQALSQEIKALAAKAKEGKLQPSEYEGGSFTISNLGMYGVTSFQAIVNPPQAAILAVGTVQDRPVVKNGQVVTGKVLSITLSCDHRVVDGAEGAQFIQTLKRLIENPILFLSA